VVSRKVTLIKNIRYAAPHPGHLANPEPPLPPTAKQGWILAFSDDGSSAELLLRDVS